MRHLASSEARLQNDFVFAVLKYCTFLTTFVNEIISDKKNPE